MNNEKNFNAIDTVLIRPEEDKYAPPLELIGVSVIGKSLFIDVYKYEETSNTRTLTITAKVPVINVDDFLSAIGTCIGMNVGTNVYSQRSS